jgi:predicted nucleic acid-binding protein
MTRIYLDSCMVIDLVEGNPSRQHLLVKRMQGKWIYSSELVRLESRIKAIRESQSEYLNTYDAYFAASEFVPLDRGVFDRATLLRVRYKIKTPDALHLAAALQAECEEFWSEDGRLKAAAEGNIRIVDWMELSRID